MKKTLMIFLLIIGSAHLTIAKVKQSESIKTDTSNLSRFLLEQNKRHLDTLRPIPDSSFAQGKETHDPAQTRNLDINKYRPYIDNIDPDDPELEAKYQKAKQWETIKIITGIIFILSFITVLILFERRKRLKK